MTPDSTPLTAAEAIAPVIAEAKALGLDFRPISGLTVKRATRLGIDIDELGKASESSLSDGTYMEQVMLMGWLLSAPEEEIAAALTHGKQTDLVEAWQARYVPTIKHDVMVMRGFMVRWLEYRVEMAEVFGTPEESAEK